MLVSVIVPTLTLTVGAVPSNIFIAAWLPGFVPSVNLAYTVSPWFKLLTVTGLFAAVD